MSNKRNFGYGLTRLYYKMQIEALKREASVNDGLIIEKSVNEEYDNTLDNIDKVIKNPKTIKSNSMKTVSVSIYKYDELEEFGEQVQHEAKQAIRNRILNDTDKWLAPTKVLAESLNVRLDYDGVGDGVGDCYLTFTSNTPRTAELIKNNFSSRTKIHKIVAKYITDIHNSTEDSASTILNSFINDLKQYFLEYIYFQSKVVTTNVACLQYVEDNDLYFYNDGRIYIP